jgi:hypothetical protein
MNQLTISKDLSLPDEAVTQTFAILAKRGVGKTYTASVMAEEMLKKGLQVVIVDPIGVWWGLRSSADGQSDGLPIIIAGGEKADIPIEPSNGEVLANLIVEQRLSIVVDISLFRKGEQHRFMTTFAETLYRKNRQAMHLILDEADEFAPQRTMGDEARMLGAIEDLVRRGRARGIGVTMITQRPAVLNKNVLTQIEVLIALRLTSPQDRAAIAEWVKYHADNDEAQKMLGSLSSLPVGTAWFWSPGWLDTFKRIEVRKRETLDSSSTPKTNTETITPHKMANVNLENLRIKLATTIEKVESKDPKFLQHKIIELEKQLANHKPKIERIEVPIIKPETLQTLLDALRPVTDLAQNITAILPHTNTSIKPTVKPLTIQKPIKSENSANFTSETPLGAGEYKVLVAISQHSNGVTRQQLTILTGYKRSTRNTYLQRLKQRGFINEDTERITATDNGRETLGNNLEPLPIGADLRQYLLTSLPIGERKILELLIESYPDSVSREQITEYTDYAQSSRNAYLQRMKAREIIESDGSRIRASDELFNDMKGA